MKKLILPLSLAVLGFAGLPDNVSAQRNDPRVDVARLEQDTSQVRESHASRYDHDNRAADDLDRLSREVRQVRLEIGDSRNQRIRDRFHRVVRATDRLRSAYERHQIRGWEVRRRADEIRVELDQVRRELRRSGGYHGHR